MSFNDKVTHRGEVTFGGGLFPEIWLVEVVKNWGSNPPVPEYHIDHIEFRATDGNSRSISETGYRSEFCQIQGKVINYVRRLAEELAKKPIASISIKEVK